MVPYRLVVPHSIQEAVVAQALADRPFECCGLLAGAIDKPNLLGRVLQRFPLLNGDASPTTFTSEPRSMFDAVREMRRLGIEILAIYHSHPTTDAVPSRTDLAHNFSTEVMNLIVSLKAPVPVIRAWWLTETDFREAEWEIGPEHQ